MGEGGKGPCPAEEHRLGGPLISSCWRKSLVSREGTAPALPPAQPTGSGPCWPRGDSSDALIRWSPCCRPRLESTGKPTVLEMSCSGLISRNVPAPPHRGHISRHGSTESSLRSVYREFDSCAVVQGQRAQPIVAGLWARVPAPLCLPSTCEGLSTAARERR